MEKLTAFVILAIVAAVVYLTQTVGNALQANGIHVAQTQTGPLNTATLEYSQQDNNGGKIRVEVPVPALPSIGK